MARSTTSAARAAPRRAASSYAPPTPLEDLHILDVLELTGSQAKAGAALAMHQSTVCRSLQLMRQQFRLVPEEGPPVCRHGHNACLHHLRLAYREHRLMEGLLRIGTDPLHQHLLLEMAGVQQVPPRVRHGEHWAELVRHGLLDGAIVSSFCLQSTLQANQQPQWDGLAALALGELQLQLVATTPKARRVLLPRRGAAGLLHQAVAWHGLTVEQQPAACQEPAAWIKRARDRELALLLCPQLLKPSCLQTNGLAPLPEQPQLQEQLWLLLPVTVLHTSAARQALRLLRSQVAKAQTMQDLHGPRADPRFRCCASAPDL